MEKYTVKVIFRLVENDATDKDNRTVQLKTFKALKETRLAHNEGTMGTLFF